MHDETRFENTGLSMEAEFAKGEIVTILDEVKELAPLATSTGVTDAMDLWKKVLAAITDQGEPSAISRYGGRNFRGRVILLRDSINKLPPKEREQLHTFAASLTVE